MTISAIFSDPKTKSEELFNIPIATEKFFNEYWIPGIQHLNLEWLIIFSTGINVSNDDWPFIAKELSLFKDWALKEYPKEISAQIASRVDLLLVDLNSKFDNTEVNIYIG